jgi:hypothetical protein
MTSFLLAREKIYECKVSCYNKLAGNGVQINTSPIKSLHHLAVDSGASKYSAHNATKLLELYQYKIIYRQVFFLHDFILCDFALT